MISEGGNQMKFGINLKCLRKQRKLSQEDLAEKVGVSRQSVSKWETGDAYPEMNHILMLCKIFHCQINDLVNENISDINSLDEEIKMASVKFQKDKQKQMKGISKAVYFLARICKIFLILVITILGIAMIATPFILKNIKVTDTHVKIYNETFEYEITDLKIAINSSCGKTTTYNDNTVVYNVIELFKNSSDMQLIMIGEFILLLATGSVILLMLVTRKLDKLFVNIHKGDTPFTLENISYIKSIAKLLIGYIIVSNVIDIPFSRILGIEFSVTSIFSNLIYILIIWSMAYIFEYGYEIQLDSKGKMYGEE